MMLVVGSSREKPTVLTADSASKLNTRFMVLILGVSKSEMDWLEWSFGE